jgi:hypothetical protein
MARPPKNRDIEDDKLPAETAAAVTDAHNQAAALQGAVQQGINLAALINQRIGKRSVLNAMQKFLTAVDLTDLATIKAGKSYKGFVYLRSDGTTLTIGTWEEYCVNVEGRSVQGVDDYLASYKTFGPELYDAMRNVGLGPSKMRSLRQLPEEQQAQLDMLKSLDDKDEIVELVDALLDKQRSKLAEREATIEEQAQTMSARDAVAATNRETIDELQTQNEKLKRHAETLTPDERDGELRAEAQLEACAIESMLRGRLCPLIAEALDNGETNCVDAVPWVNGVFDVLAQVVQQAREQFGTFGGVMDYEPNDVLATEAFNEEAPWMPGMGADDAGGGDDDILIDLPE